MKKKIEILLEKYAVYITSVGGIMLLGAIGISIFALSTALSWNTRQLAVSVIIIAIGGLINMLNLFRTSKKQDEYATLKRDELNKKDEELDKKDKELDRLDETIKALKEANSLMRKQMEDEERRWSKDREPPIPPW